MPKMLETNGVAVTKSVKEFERYDLIRYSRTNPALAVDLALSTGGVLDLASELGTVSATIMGSAAGNAITTGAGNDTIYGGEKDDVLHGNRGDDKIYGLLGDDTLFGDAGDDRLEGSGGNDTIHGGIGDDLIFDSSGSRTTIFGEAGNDTVNLLSSNIARARLDGGAGRDVLIAPQHSLLGMKFLNFEILSTQGSSVTGSVRQFESFTHLAHQGDLDNITDAVSLTLITKGRLDLSEELGLRKLSITASAAGNHMVGGDGDDLITGSDRPDTLDGRGGIDTLNGGKGDDIYIVGDLDILFEPPGGGTDTIRSSIRWEMENGFENLILTGNLDANGFGNAGANVMRGNSAYNYLDGRGGHDTLAGGDYGDYYALADTMTIDGALEFDEVIEKRGGGNDTVSVSSEVGRLTYVLDKNIEIALVTGANAFNLVGNGLDNKLTGNDADNVLSGGGGDDELFGSDGVNTLFGGRGDDILFGSSTKSIKHGGEGNDILQGSIGIDVLIFDTKLNAKTNVDTVLTYDLLLDYFNLDSGIFSALTSGGPLSVAEFHVGRRATTSEHHIIYDSSTGDIFYDPDGTGHDGQVRFALAQDSLALDAGDFVII